MPLTWVLRDVTAQLEQLLTRKLELDHIAKRQRAAERAAAAAEKKKEGKADDTTDDTSIEDGPAVLPATGPVASLNIEEVTKALQNIQVFIQKFAVQRDVPDMCSRMTHLSEQYAGRRPAERKKVDKAGKTVRPSTQDKKATVDELKDRSVSFYILETMHRFFSSIVHSETSYRRQDEFDHDPAGAHESLSMRLTHTPTNVIEFLFNHLHHTYSSAVRHAAGESLGVLSKTFLAPILQMFTEQSNKLKKEKEMREYASYQKAVRFLDFGVSSREQFDLTVNYLNALHEKLMKRVERGVLRQEICNSLKDVFTNMLNPVNPAVNARRKREWEELAKSGARLDELWAAYDKIFQLVSKWSSKSKHTQFCYDLLWKMVVLTREGTWYANKKRFDIFGALVKGVKEEKLRIACLGYLRDYLRELPQQFVDSEPEGFIAQLRSLFSTLFPKGKAPLDDEVPYMIDIVANAARKSLPFVMAEPMLQMLGQKSGYATLQKSIMLKACGVVSAERPQAVIPYHHQLGAATALYIEDSKERKGEAKEFLPLRAALTCFPHIRHPSMERCQLTAGCIIPMTLSPDREVANGAAIALQHFVALSPKENFIHTVHCYLDLLANPEGVTPEHVLHTCQNITLLFVSLRDLIRTTGLKRNGIFTSLSEWIALRQHLEGVTLIVSCNFETWVRSEIARLIQLFSCHEFRALEIQDERDREDVPFMVDYINLKPPDVAPATPELLSVPLVDFLTTNYDQFAGVIGWAFSQLHTNVERLLKLPAADRDALTDSSDWYLNYKNIFVFLCLVIRPAADETISADVELKTPKDKGSKKEKTAEAKADEYQSIVQVRPRLDKWKMQYAHTSFFFDRVYQLMHLKEESPQLYAILRSLTGELARLHSSCYQPLTQVLRRPLLVEEAVGKGGKKLVAGSLQGVGPRAREDFFFHEHTLDVLARILVKTTPQQYHERVTPLTKTLDELVSKWSEEINTPMFANQTLRGKRHIASMMAQYIAYRSHTPFNNEHISKDTLVRARASLFDFLRSPNLLPTDKAKVLEASNRLEPAWGADLKKNLRSLEKVVMQAMAALLLLSPIHDRDLEDRMLNMLHGMSLKDPAVANQVGICFEVFLRVNPHRLPDFIGRCSPELFRHMPTKKVAATPQSTSTNTDLPPYAAAPAPAGAVGQGPQPSIQPPSSPVGLPSTPQSSVMGGEAKGFAAEDAKYSAASMNGAPVGATAGVSPTPVGPSGAPLSHRRRQHVVVAEDDHADLVHCDAVAKTQGAKLAVLYLKAVCANWMSAMDVWLNTHGVSPALMLVTASLHQCSPDETARLWSLRLAAELAKRPRWAGNESLDPGYAIRPFSHRSPFMYTEQAIRYSSALGRAPRNFPLLAPLLVEITTMNRYLTEGKKELLLRLLVPWVSQFGPGLALLKEQPKMTVAAVDNTANTVLLLLLGVTRQTFGSPVLCYQLEDLWVSILSQSAHVEAVADRLIAFVIAQYVVALTESPFQRAEREDLKKPEGQAAREELLRSATVAAAPNGTSSMTPTERAKARVDAVAQIEGGARPASKADRALLKMVWTQLCRSRHVDLLMNRLCALLRHYPDAAPTDPTSFLEWQKNASRSTAREETTRTERAAFELVLNIVCESGGQFRSHLPLLLHNACVMFHGTSSGTHLLQYVAMSLGTYDYSRRGAVNGVLTDDMVINGVVDTYPDLRDEWATLAFTWACNSRDGHVASRSYELFEKLQARSFHFGEGQLTLARLVMNSFIVLRQSRTQQLKQLVSVLLMPAATTYDKESWSLIVSLGWSMLSISNPLHFTAGMSLLSHMFNAEVEFVNQKRWIQDLSGLFSVTSSSGVDVGVADVLSKGLERTTSAEQTLDVLRAMAAFHSDSLPVNNRIIILLMLGNMLLRAVDLVTLLKEYQQPQMLSDAQRDQKQMEHVRRVDSCVDIGRLLYVYARRADAAKKPAIVQLCLVFKQLALSLARGLPDVQPDRPIVDGQILTYREQTDRKLNRERRFLFKKLASLIEMTREEKVDMRDRPRRGDVYVPPLDGVTLPGPENLLSQFFHSFAAVFNESKDFHFVLTSLAGLLKDAPQEWKRPLWVMVGNHLQFSTSHATVPATFTLLGEPLVNAYAFDDKSLQTILENIAFLLVRKSDTEQKDVFNFIRARPKKLAPLPDINDGAARQPEIEEALTRLQNFAFPIMGYMIAHPRAMPPRVRVERKDVNNVHSVVPSVLVTPPASAAAAAAASSSSSSAAVPPSGLAIEVSAPVNKDAPPPQSSPISVLHSNVTTSTASMALSPPQAHSRRLSFAAMAPIPSSFTSNQPQMQQLEVATSPLGGLPPVSLTSVTSADPSATPVSAVSETVTSLNPAGSEPVLFQPAAAAVIAEEKRSSSAAANDDSDSDPPVESLPPPPVSPRVVPAAAPTSSGEPVAVVVREPSPEPAAAPRQSMAQMFPPPPVQFTPPPPAHPPPPDNAAPAVPFTPPPPSHPPPPL